MPCPHKPLLTKPFRNEGDFGFSSANEAWGFEQPTFSNGSAYGDLDNDGDLDLVINNVNMPALVYKNNSDTLTHRSLQIKLDRLAVKTPLKSEPKPSPMHKELNPLLVNFIHQKDLNLLFPTVYTLGWETPKA